MTQAARPTPDHSLRTLCTTALLAALLSLAGCSSIQFAYGQLDRWLRWQLDDYVDLDREQKRQLQASLDSFLAWHRQTQLPRYADAMTELAERVETGEPEDLPLETLEDRARGFWEAASTQFFDLLIPLATRLRPEQLSELAENFREKREESLEEWRESPEEVEQRRRKRIRKHSERWLGSLTDEQEALISTWVSRVAYDPLLRDRQRQKWQARFLQLLRNKPDNYRAQLRDLMLNPQQLWSDEYRQMQEERQRRARALGEKMLASTTPEQQQHLAETLREYAQDFRELANR